MAARANKSRKRKQDDVSEGPFSIAERLFKMPRMVALVQRVRHRIALAGAANDKTAAADGALARALRIPLQSGAPEGG